MADSYTLKKLTEAEDMAAKMGYGEMGSARFPAKDLDAEDTGLALHKLNPGARQAFAHKHDKAEEVCVVIEGSGRVKLDDDIVDLGGLDALRISPGVTRQFEGGPEGMTMLVFGPHHDGDGEMLPDWWND